MTIELAEKKVIDIVRDNLEHFKKIEDEAIKSVVSDLEGALADYDAAIEVEEPKQEEPKEEPVVAESETHKEEVKEEVEPEVEEPISKEEPAPEPVVEKAPEVKEKPAPVEENEKVVAGDVQLSMEVADTLKKAAIELDNKDKELNTFKLELSAKDEIIDGYKNKVLELGQAIDIYKQEVEVFKKKQELELKQQKESIVKDLIELYANLNIQKTTDELHVFGLSQLVELRKALEVTLEKKNTPVRETNNSHVFVKQQQTDSVDKAQETFEGLFGKNPDMY